MNRIQRRQLEAFVFQASLPLGLAGVQIVEDETAFPTQTTLAVADVEMQIVYVRKEYETQLDLFFAVAHELRHIWQAKAHGISFFENHGTSGDVTTEEYNLRPEEIDANAYAALVMIDQFKRRPLFNGLPENVKQKIEQRMREIVAEYGGVYNRTATGGASAGEGEIKMKKTNTKITRYTDGKYSVYIEQNGSRFDAWLGQVDFGVLSYMFGQENTTEEQFMHIVSDVLKDYEAQYKTDYEF